MHRSTRRCAVAGLLGALLVLQPAAHAADGSVTIAQVDGQQVVDGRIVREVKGSTLTLSGSAQAPTQEGPALLADAGDSSYVLSGTRASLIASAGGGEAPYTFAWSYEGSTSRFADHTDFDTTFDTNGLTGPLSLSLTVTDEAGRSATDTVQLFAYALSQQTLMKVSETVGASALGLNAPKIRKPFDVPAGVDTTGLRLELDWQTSYALPGTTPPDEDFGGFNLEVEDPTGAEVSAGQGGQFTKPEDVNLSKVAPGTWNAVIVRTLTAPDTYTLTVASTSRPADPVPTVVSGGPYSFTPGQPQILRATTGGGTAPLSTAWDLDYDGVFESPDTANGVTTALPLGDHLVTVKTTDAAGYERRETTAVRVATEVSPDATPGLVVVAVSDTGLNPYHQDFRASTFKDARILALTNNFTKHPSEYIAGYPTTAPAKTLTFGQPFAPGKFHPAADAAQWTKGAMPLNKLHWIPGTKIVAAVDTGDSQPVNGAPDAVPFLDEDGHGTASASVAVGNLYGYCSTCLLAFGENFNSDGFYYNFPWVDLASNSFGSAGNIGFAGLIDASQPKANAERGQIALYAAGNGNENAFVTPQQTYTAENLGADWLVRVGAVDKRDRKPIVGTGKPVDISSWGIGGGDKTLPAASNTSPGGVTTHSGTSAATPYSSGVFGTVLGQVRELLGDRSPGQKNTTGNGIIAKGTPVPGSTYLGDGILTRAELVETVFKTARHDINGDSIGYPVSTPNNPHQYVVEGYGIVEPESGARALDVLTGKAPLPLRPAEDDFFEADSALRDELWGTWKGGGANSGSTSAGSSNAAAPSANPFEGATAASVGTFASAYALLSEVAGPFRSSATASMAAAQEAGGLTFWAHHQGGCVNAADPGPFLDTTDTEGDDDGCGAAGLGGVIGNEVESWTAAAGSQVTIPKDTKVTGVIYLQTQQPADTLVDVFVSANGRSLGTASSGVLFVEEGLFNDFVGVPFTFDTASEVVPGESLTLSVSLFGTATWFFGYEGDHATSLTFATTAGGGGGGDPLGAVINSPAPGTVVDPAKQPTLAVGGTATFPAADAANRVEVALDDATFAAPTTATLGTDGTWGASFDATSLADGTHTVHARAVDTSGQATAAPVEFTVTRPVQQPDDPSVVQVQVVPAGSAPNAGGWIVTNDTSPDGDLSSWSAALDIGHLPKGEYDVHARLMVDGAAAALDGPVAFTKKSPVRGGRSAS